MKIAETYTAAVISTAHIAYEDVERINLGVVTRRVGLKWVMSIAFGWLIRLDVLLAGEESLPLEAMLIKAEISEATRRNLMKLYDAGFQAVHLDRDAPLVDDLESWDW
ncbi:hypothetical protein MWH03_00270 [Klebsiella pneumoniae]|nr:hypothetical protein [Klebsiella pneumoniae]